MFDSQTLAFLHLFPTLRLVGRLCGQLSDLLKGWLIAGVGGLKWDKSLEAETLTDTEQ